MGNITSRDPVCRKADPLEFMMTLSCKFEFHWPNCHFHFWLWIVDLWLLKFSNIKFRGRKIDPSFHCVNSVALNCQLKEQWTRQTLTYTNPNPDTNPNPHSFIAVVILLTNVHHVTEPSQRGNPATPALQCSAHTVSPLFLQAGDISTGMCSQLVRLCERLKKIPGSWWEPDTPGGVYILSQTLNQTSGRSLSQSQPRTFPHQVWSCRAKIPNASVFHQEAICPPLLLAVLLPSVWMVDKINADVVFVPSSRPTAATSLLNKLT